MGKKKVTPEPYPKADIPSAEKIAEAYRDNMTGVVDQKNNVDGWSDGVIPKKATMLGSRNLSKASMLTLLLGTCTLIGIRYGIKHGWLIANTYWLTHRSVDNTDKWFI